MEHDVEALVVVPTVLATPKIAVAVLADLAGGADIVGHDATVLVDAVDPCLHVVQHPLFLFLVAAVEIGVGDQGRGTQIRGLVALQDHLVEEIENFFDQMVLRTIGAPVA